MGYMIKSDILNALKEDKEASLYLFRKNKPANKKSRLN